MNPLRLPLVALLAAALPGWAAAQNTDIEQVRATTEKLIRMLADQGVLPKARVDALMAQVQAPPAAEGPAAAASAAKGGTVRVPYVPEFVRKEIKEELRNEIAAQGIREGWAGPGAVPAWVRSIKTEGDLRTRVQVDRFDSNNASAVGVTETNRARALTLVNTTEDRTRLRVRARMGVTATADDNWSAGVRFSTGNTTDPLSANQTLGNYGTRFTAVIDRAYARYNYGDQLNVVAGRFGNPWFGTDLMWANDLGFDGVAAQWTPRIGPSKGYVTVAAVPVQEVELSRSDKWLFGAQIGADAQTSNQVVRAKFGVGYFRYVNMLGKPNAPGSSLNDYTAPAFTQKGNSYFNISSDSARPLLALASEYKIVNLTGLFDMEMIGGKHLVLSSDYVRNIGFKRADVSARMGFDVVPQVNGYLFRVGFGDNEISRRGQWQGYFYYKRVERDAVLDAYTDSDLRLGGTDTKGFVLGASYGLGHNTAASVRWLSGDAISGPPLSIDLLQVDLSMRF